MLTKTEKTNRKNTMNKTQLKQTIQRKKQELKALYKALNTPETQYDFRDVPTVAELRTAGVKVRVIEQRRGFTDFRKKQGIEHYLYVDFDNYYPRKELSGDLFYNKGGVTTVQILFNGVEYQGEAHCADVDGFNRKFGVKMATKRALENISYETRVELRNKLKAE
jgi:hypothetical protein